MAMTVHVDIVSAEGEIFPDSLRWSMLTALWVNWELRRVIRRWLRLKPERSGSTRGSGEMRHFTSPAAFWSSSPVITILADTAIRARDLDEAAAEEANGAQERLPVHADFEYAKGPGGIGGSGGSIEGYRKAAQSQEITERLPFLPKKTLPNRKGFLSLCIVSPKCYLLSAGGCQKKGDKPGIA